jgi:hypothetical protein
MSALSPSALAMTIACPSNVLKGTPLGIHARVCCSQTRYFTNAKQVDQSPAYLARKKSLESLHSVLVLYQVLSCRNGWTAHLTAARSCHPFFLKNLASSRCSTFRHSEVLWSSSHIRARNNITLMRVQNGTQNRIHGNRSSTAQRKVYH